MSFSKRFQIIVLPRAESDMDCILEWIAVRSPAGARAWISALEDAFERIALDPMRFEEVREAAMLEESLKQCLFKTKQGRIYRVVFLLDRDKVTVVRIRGPGQPPLTSDEIR